MSNILHLIQLWKKWLGIHDFIAKIRIQTKANEGIDLWKNRFFIL